MKKTSIVIIAALAINVVSGQGKPDQSDLAAMQSGKTDTFNGSGHAKSKGLSFKINVPNSWSNKEGNTENIVQRFFNKNETTQLHVVVRNLPEPITPEIAELLYSDASLKNISDQMGWTCINTSSFAIDEEPAGYLEYNTKIGWMGSDYPSHGCFFVVCWRDKMIHLNFIVGKKGMTEEQAASEFGRYLPVFRSIAKSFVFQGKRK